MPDEKSQQFTIENKTATGVTINVSIPYPTIERALPKAAERISNELEIEGFRKGKAPYDVIKQRVGEFKILEEASRMYVERHFTEILENVEDTEYKGKSFEPIGEPTIAITKLAPGENFEYKITLTLLPQLELPDYKAIAKEVLAGKKTPEVTESEIESSINWLRDSRAKLITVTRPAENGDKVEVDFSATHGGVLLENTASKNHPIIIGEGRVLPGFDEAMIGMKANESKTFPLLIPSDHPDKNIAGKNLEMSAEMKLVQERIMPEWNDEFARSLGDFSDAVDVTKNIREGMMLEKETKERERMRMEMIDEIARQVRAEIPEPLIARELEKMVAELRQSIDRMGLKFDEYLEHIKKNTDGLKLDWRRDAERRVKIALALRDIARREKINPSDKDIRETREKTATRLGLSEENLKTIDAEAFSDYNRGIARNEKVFQFLESPTNYE